MRYYKKTPIGIIAIECEGSFITKLLLNQRESEAVFGKEESKTVRDAFTQLDEYFAGTRKKFTLALKPEGTDFMKRVWLNVAKVPYGKTASYKEIAILCGNSRAMRAVGLANNRNPIPIFIPCHRIIGSNGKLVGYGGGLAMKKALLDLETSTKI